MANLRTKNPETAQPNLLQAHRAALWEGFMLLGLVWAVALSDLSTGLETTAAALLVTGGTFQLLATTIAWRQNLTNLFSPPRGMVFQIARIHAILQVVGLVILVVGAIRSLY